MNKLKFVFFSYLIAIVSLFIYSFTQVDLSLTLSKVSIYQSLEKQLQHVGFFERPASALIFSVIVGFLFFFYFLFLYLAKKDKIKINSVKLLTFLIFIILVFSYNAFSYDLFNYIFDAKIVSFYHQNPYLHKALDFTGDPMLSFMRWTHRLYPYGPGWLALTVPLSFIGMNYFLITFFLFKSLIGLSFLGSSFLIYKISEIVSPKNKIYNTVFWSFNPLVIIEGLVSAHNDFPMIFFALLSIYLYLSKRKVYSLIFYAFSVGIKYSTGALLPVFALILYMEKTKKTIDWEKIFLWSLLLSLLVIIVASIRTTFQPWYLIFSFSIASFLSKKYYVLIPAAISSIFAISIYIVYVLMTDYSKGYPQIFTNIEYAGLICSIVFTPL